MNLELSDIERRTRDKDYLKSIDAYQDLVDELDKQYKLLDNDPNDEMFSITGMLILLTKLKLIQEERI